MITEQLPIRRSTSTESLVSYLEAALPRGFVVVGDLTLDGCRFDLLVVGPSELFVLHVQRGRTPPALEGRRTALAAFLRRELPDQTVPVQHLVVSDNPDASAVPDAGRPSRGLAPDRAVELILASDPPGMATAWQASLGDVLLPRLTKQSLDLSRRTTEPFITRSGDEAWSVAEVVRILDRRRADGVFHLRNGSLARWLAEQGAEPLAEIARSALQIHGTDGQMALESFLLDTGLVEHPQLQVTPNEVDLGYVLVGQKNACHLHIQKGKGRGYLAGTIHSPHAWLHVTPDKFSGDSVDAVVRVDIESLAIRREPYRTALEIHSNASREPISVPVSFQVMPLPSALQRRLLRPVLGAALLGAVGTGLGLLLWLLEPTGTGAAVAWGVAVLWALAGLLLGARQPEAWPLSYAWRRWLGRILRWQAVLFGVAALLLGGWHWLAVDLGWPAPGVGPWFAGVAAAAAAILPAVRAELREQHRARVAALPVPRPLWRQAVPVAATLALTVSLLLGAHWAGGTWQRYSADGTVETVQVQVEGQWRSWEARLDEWIDQATIRYYESRRGDRSDLLPDWARRFWRWVQHG